MDSKPVRTWGLGSNESKDKWILVRIKEEKVMRSPESRDPRVASGGHGQPIISSSPKMEGTREGTEEFDPPVFREKLLLYR